MHLGIDADAMDYTNDQLKQDARCKMLKKCGNSKILKPPVSDQWLLSCEGKFCNMWDVIQQMELASCIFGILFNRHFGFWNRRYFLSGILDCLIVDIVILDLWIMDIIQLYSSCKGGTVIVIFMQLLEKDWKLYDQKLGGLIWIKSSDGFLKTKDWRKSAEVSQTIQRWPIF